MNRFAHLCIPASLLVGAVLLGSSLSCKSGAAPEKAPAPPAVTKAPVTQPVASEPVADKGPLHFSQGGDYPCYFTANPIEVDGKPSEEAWKNAPVIDRFQLPWLKQPRPSITATRARLMWDREYIYFLAEMDDSDLYAGGELRDGRIWDNDVFELFFKPSKEKKGYYEFEVNAKNVILDMFLPSRNSGGYERFKSEMEIDITTAVQLNGTLNRWEDKDKGWTVEGRISWKSFIKTGGRPQPGEVWTFALARYDFSVDFEGPELSTTAFKAGNRPDFHRFEDFNPIKFMGPNESKPAEAGKPQAAVEPSSVLPPLTTSTVVGAPTPPPPYKAVRAYPNLQLRYPVAIANQPGSNLMFGVVESHPYGPTKVIRFFDEATVDKTEELLSLDAVAYGFTFHPKFAENGYVYISMNGPTNRQVNRQSKIVRYHIDPKPPYTFDPKSATTILEWSSQGHNGGATAFGKDGLFYVTTGDGTSDSDEWISGQDLSRIYSKVLRIDIDRPANGKQYSIPKGNPFAGQKDAMPETWAYGLRNPWRMSIDPENGQMWLAQNGQDYSEQVYLIRKGENYGWSAQEGSLPFIAARHKGVPITPPTAEHLHSEARSLTGGFSYYGSALPKLRGTYIYGDYSTGKIWGIRHDGSKVTFNEELADTPMRITGFGTNASGDLLLLDHVQEGGIYRLEVAPPSTVATKFPRKLSESGLFKSVAKHEMEDGILPYSVNAELWSDGAHKERFIAIPSKEGIDRKIGFRTGGGFNFPNETVLVKSFALETEAGKPESRKWIETRFFTKQEDEWVGYSYEWNEDGTDATLVEAAGRDKQFAIKDASAPGGIRKQDWHYPSRAECMVCHSRAANFVLGPNLLQMNKDHDYGKGYVNNQLRELERLNLLTVDWAGEARGSIKWDGKSRGMEKKELDEYVRRQVSTRDQREAAPSSLLAKDPTKYENLVNPYDATADLNKRARSYLDSNCAMCHMGAGGGNASIDLGYRFELAEMKSLDEKPIHTGFKLPDPRIIASGTPERSVLLHRMAVRGQGQMPPVATHLVDDRAVKLMRDWIATLKPIEPTPEASAATATP